jgi:hypothetical protein
MLPATATRHDSRQPLKGIEWLMAASADLWLPDHESRSNHLLQSGRIKLRTRAPAPRTEVNMHFADGLRWVEDGSVAQAPPRSIVAVTLLRGLRTALDIVAASPK